MILAARSLGLKHRGIRGRSDRCNHTLKRALTSPQLFSGIATPIPTKFWHRARLSPVALSQKLTREEIERLHRATRDTLTDWTEKLRAETGDGFPEHVTAFRGGMTMHGASASHVRTVARPSSASAMPTTKPITAHTARPAASSSQTDRYRCC